MLSAKHSHITMEVDVNVKCMLPSCREKFCLNDCNTKYRGTYIVTGILHKIQLSITAFMNLDVTIQFCCDAFYPTPMASDWVSGWVAGKSILSGFLSEKHEVSEIHTWWQHRNVRCYNNPWGKHGSNYWLLSSFNRK